MWYLTVHGLDVGWLSSWTFDPLFTLKNYGQSSLHFSKRRKKKCKTMRKVGLHIPGFFSFYLNGSIENTGRWKSDKAAQETTIYFNFPSKLTRSFPEALAKFNIPTPWHTSSQWEGYAFIKGFHPKLFWWKKVIRNNMHVCTSKQTQNSKLNHLYSIV